MMRGRALVAPVVLLAVLLAPKIVLAAGQFKGRCLKVHDRDTISVMHDGDFRGVVSRELLQRVYEQIRRPVAVAGAAPA